MPVDDKAAELRHADEREAANKKSLATREVSLALKILIYLHYNHSYCQNMMIFLVNLFAFYYNLVLRTLRSAF